MASWRRAHSDHCFFFFFSSSYSRINHGVTAGKQIEIWNFPAACGHRKTTTSTSVGYASFGTKYENSDRASEKILAGAHKHDVLNSSPIRNKGAHVVAAWRNKASYASYLDSKYELNFWKTLKPRSGRKEGRSSRGKTTFRERNKQSRWVDVCMKCLAQTPKHLSPPF
jgi:hypothetical protein